MQAVIDILKDREKPSPPHSIQKALVVCRADGSQMTGSCVWAGILSCAHWSRCTLSCYLPPSIGPSMHADMAHNSLWPPRSSKCLSLPADVTALVGGCLRREDLYSVRLDYSDLEFLLSVTVDSSCASIIRLWWGQCPESAVSYSILMRPGGPEVIHFRAVFDHSKLLGLLLINRLTLISNRILNLYSWMIWMV
jgi:hypothetical protein